LEIIFLKKNKKIISKTLTTGRIRPSGLIRQNCLEQAEHQFNEAEPDKTYMRIPAYTKNVPAYSQKINSLNNK